MKGAVLRRVIALTATMASVLLAPSAADAATAVTDVDYDLDGSAVPVPASLGRLDLYLPDGAQPSDRRPVVVYVHGGGWRVGDKGNRIGDKVGLFTGAGYGFASINYRLSPDPIDPAYPPDRVRFPDHPDDVGEAIGWIDRNVGAFGGDPERIIMIGHSAGAQIVALVATDPGYVQRWGVKPKQLLGAIPLDGEYDIPNRIETGSNRSRTMFYNAFATPAENAVDGAWRLGSPIEWAGPSDPPLLVVTQQDAPFRAAAAGRMVDALGPAANLLSVPYDHEGINAAVGAADDPAGETAAIMSFIREALGDARAPKVRIKSRPRNRIRLHRHERRAKVAFRFEPRSGSPRLQCRLDDDRFRRCDSPARYRAGKGR
ncbi:MAG: alpha/beta hydrolase, partial [Solirubrobacterales bacterium]|nr:alpha/beta hydrolase [Solirubrobacterales bacterium]